MRKMKTLLASLSLALVCTYAGAVHAMFLNGSFETGDYTGWTLDESSGNFNAGTWGIASTGQTIIFMESVFDFFDGVDVVQFSDGLPITYTPTDGDFMALQLQNEAEIHRMYQDILLPSTATELNWDMFYTNHLNAFSPTQFLAAYLRDPSSDLVLDTLFETVPGDATSIAMTAFAADVSAFSGQTVRFDIFMNVQDNFFDAGFDNFRITSATPVPEPVSAVLVGLGLAGFCFRRRRSL